MQHITVSHVCNGNDMNIQKLQQLDPVWHMLQALNPTQTRLKHVSNAPSSFQGPGPEIFRKFRGPGVWLQEHGINGFIQSTSRTNHAKNLGSQEKAMVLGLLCENQQETNILNILARIRFGLIWLDLARPGSTWLDLGSTRLDLARPGSTLVARPGSTWLDLARPGSTWLDLARPGSTWARLPVFLVFCCFL